MSVDLTNLHGEHMVALWAALDQQEVALVPALRALALTNEVYDPFLQYAIASSKGGQFDAPRLALFEETKRRYLGIFENMRRF